MLASFASHGSLDIFKLVFEASSNTFPASTKLKENMRCFKTCIGVRLTHPGCRDPFQINICNCKHV